MSCDNKITAEYLRHIADSTVHRERENRRFISLLGYLNDSAYKGHYYSVHSSWIITPEMQILLRERGFNVTKLDGDLYNCYKISWDKLT